MRVTLGRGMARRAFFFAVSTLRNERLLMMENLDFAILRKLYVTTVYESAPREASGKAWIFAALRPLFDDEGQAVPRRRKDAGPDQRGDGTRHNEERPG